MDPRSVWPDFLQSWILYEDEDLVAVHKPAGMASQSADPERPDDVVFRLRSYLKRRDGHDVKLGVHQRLDRETSGVLVFAKSARANASLSQQFEGRAVEKVYVACVSGAEPAKRDTVFKDFLGPGKEGKRAVVAPRTAGAREAVTRVKVLKREGERSLLELRLETGRTHQARIQLAHRSMPIGGDGLYRGAFAPRLLLHAASLELTAPDGRRRLRFDAPLPRDFHRWLGGTDTATGIFDDSEALAEALERALHRRYGFASSWDGPRATTAFRLVNESGDALPGLAVDVYGGHLVAQFYEGPDNAWDMPRRQRVYDALSRLGFDGIYAMMRPKQANTLVDTRREDVAPKEPVVGAPAPEDLVILEEGIPYGVKLGDGLSTGIFLDQRENRRRLRELSSGRSVLNLFAYTCAFSVAAAEGGAWRTMSVDVSASALERGRANLERVGRLDAGQHEFAAEDVFRWLARAARSGDKFDIVVLDPPSYSTTKSRRFSSGSDYEELAAQAMALVGPHGKLVACSNNRGISRGKFRQFLRNAAEKAGRTLVQVKDLPDPLDFPAAPGEECHLKSVLVTFAG